MRLLVKNEAEQMIIRFRFSQLISEPYVISRGNAIFILYRHFVINLENNKYLRYNFWLFDFVLSKSITPNININNHLIIYNIIFYFEDEQKMH